MRQVWVDTDPGLDDAVAIALLAASSSWEIVALSAVGGNTCLPIVSQNLVNIAHQLGLKVPVIKGLDRESRYMISSHSDLKSQGQLGTSSVTDRSRAGFFDQEESPVETESLNQLIHLLRTSQGPITLLTLGPLTNVQYVMDQAPDLIDKLDQIIMMGGCLGPGNYSDRVEFNFGFDPQATRKVMSLECAKTIIPLEVGKQVSFEMDTVRKWPVWQAIGPLVQPFLLDLHGGQVPQVIKLFDLMAAAYLIHPSAFEQVVLNLTVDEQAAILQDKQVGSSVHWTRTVNAKAILDLMRK